MAVRTLSFGEGRVRRECSLWEEKRFDLHYLMKLNQRLKESPASIEKQNYY